ncbi:AIM24 family protein [Deinococcus sp. QL22]|uniref:AIM24 family protein n=1 Tax=Deinococcus sp. QL22 TaxID=2939437 RepID=UPI00201731D1|nr:AIM24 family protein [Deinococcus sp. QL22]UQN04987.1 AIM24 family protein [Deinococcus sp. QL22]
MSHMQLVQEHVGSGLTLRVHALTHVTRFSRTPDGELGETREMDGRFTIEAELSGSGVLLEPGAFQYSLGQVEASVQQQQQGGFLRRAIATAGSGESAFATRFTGHGKVWTEPTRKHFIIAEMSGDPSDTMLLDDRAFYLAQDTMQLGTHTHSSISGILSGNGLRQPKLSGRGIFAVESPVPVSEIEVIELDGRQTLTADGDLALMYSASLNVELRPLVRGLRNAMRTGEGFVYVFSGKGTVYLTPTHRMISGASL